MIRKKEQDTIIIDLTGPEGNAFCLLGYAQRFSRQLGLDFEEIKTQMTSGGYENLVKVFDDHFGSFVVLLR